MIFIWRYFTICKCSLYCFEWWRNAESKFLRQKLYFTQVGSPNWMWLHKNGVYCTQ